MLVLADRACPNVWGDAVEKFADGLVFAGRMAPQIDARDPSIGAYSSQALETSITPLYMFGSPLSLLVEIA